MAKTKLAKYFPAYGKKRQALPQSIPWYLSGGVDAANCVAAYQAKGAASYATSKVNLANPGTYDLGENSPPTWDVSGWNSPGLLETSPVVNMSNLSVIVRFSDAPAESGGLMVYLFQYASNNIIPLYDLGEGGPYGVLYLTNTPAEGISPSASSGVLCGTKVGATRSTIGYRNGSVDGSSFTATEALPSGSPDKFIIGDAASSIKIQAVAAYNIVLDAAQVAAITTAMQAL